MEEVLDEFWNNVKATIIVQTSDEAAVIYGKNSNTGKYYGFVDSIPRSRTVEDLAIFHQLPGKLCYAYELHDKNRVTTTELEKSRDSFVQYPLKPTCHKHKQQYNYDFLGMSKFGFTYSVDKNSNLVRVVSKTSTLSRN
jgi:hypothetical protein